MPPVGGAGEGVMSRWQYWQRERGGSKTAALMELVACFMVLLLAVCALFWYGRGFGYGEGGFAIGGYVLSGLDGDVDYSKVPFSTAAYFLYVLIIIGLFSEAWLSRRQKGASQIFIAGSSVIILLVSLIFALSPSERAIHISALADIGFVSSIWYFHRSHLLNLFFTGFILRNKWKTDDEIEKELEEVGGQVQVRSSFIDNLFYITILLLVVGAWSFRAFFVWVGS